MCELLKWVYLLAKKIPQKDFLYSRKHVCYSAPCDISYSWPNSNSPGLMVMAWFFLHQRDKIFDYFLKVTYFIYGFVNSSQNHAVYTVSPASWALIQTRQKVLITYLSLSFCWLDIQCLQHCLRQVDVLTGPEITFVKFVTAFCLCGWFPFFTRMNRNK